MNEERLYKMFKHEHPETVGETDQCFDTDNYKDWLQNYVGKLEAKLLLMKLSERQQTTEDSKHHDSEALHIADVSKRFSFEQQKACKYVIEELFSVLRCEYGIKIDEQIINNAFDYIAESVFS